MLVIQQKHTHKLRKTQLFSEFIPKIAFLYIEIKSTDQIQASMLTNFKTLTKDISNSEVLCFSNDPFSKKFDHVIAIHWREGLKYVFR